MKLFSVCVTRIFLPAALLGLSLSAQATKFQAEDYGPYSDTTPGNTGGAYRGDGVDIEATQDAGGGFNVGWIDAGEWLVFNNLNIPTSGRYTINVRVASPTGGRVSMDLNGGSIVLGELAIPATGGFQSWRTVSTTVNIDAGNYSLGTYAKAGGWNFNWIEVVPAAATVASKASLYDNCPHGGWKASLDVGRYNLAALTGRGFVNDKLSSLNVDSGYEAVLYADDNFTGRSVTIRGDNSCLTGQNFNDIASSVEIRAIPSGRKLVWSDEFDSINGNNWSYDTGGGGYGNNELEYYTNGQNSFVQYDNSIGSNVLTIEARHDNPGNYGCWYGRCEYTSSRMVTRNKKSFKYGRVEARMKLPQTQGIWPAFWMLGDRLGAVEWPEAGEIDIMEHVGKEPNLTHGALHGPGYSGNTPITGTNDLGRSVDSAYHVYAVEWDTNSVRWFVDDKQFYSATRAQVERYGHWVYDDPFWILLNLAVGGNWPGNPDGSSNFPKQMYVDYVRVYQ